MYNTEPTKIRNQKNNGSIHESSNNLLSGRQSLEWQNTMALHLKIAIVLRTSIPSYVVVYQAAIEQELV